MVPLIDDVLLHYSGERSEVHHHALALASYIESRGTEFDLQLVGVAVHLSTLPPMGLQTMGCFKLEDLRDAEPLTLN